MVQNVTSLLNTVREVENENTRGSRALESTVHAISQEIRVILKIYKKKQKLISNSKNNYSP